MRAAIIENGVVVNVAEASEQFAQAKGWIASNSAETGDLWDGDVFTKPAPAPTPVPSAVTMRQARRALLEAEKLATVDALIAGMAGTAGDTARIDWEFSSEVRRDWPLVAALAPALSLTEEAIDALFIRAAQL